MLIPSSFLLLRAPDSSSNYIRQLESKVRILEDDNNKLLSQVSHTNIDTESQHSTI